MHEQRPWGLPYRPLGTAEWPEGSRATGRLPHGIPVTPNHAGPHHRNCPHELQAPRGDPAAPQTVSLFPPRGFPGASLPHTSSAATLAGDVGPLPCLLGSVLHLAGAARHSLAR